ncbi:hypothetical protein [Autumnicola musiva]|uniref:Uncharacterized protein n=1 Tax=Autumnicola musiva TaxID=3075589 RepID=A0ABU3D0Q6_9FLAO|nr:hypothetical protein [Zunongwangia sp. F117]MDT0675119.1 hypothetical protein [Zunongwangia sp. F117]
MDLQECFYCGAYTHDEKSFYTHEMVGVVKQNLVEITGYSYRTKKLNIPRCKKCHNKHELKFLYISLPLFVICFIITITLVAEYFGFAWPMIFPILAWASMLTYVLDELFEAVLFKKIYGIVPEGKITAYPPVRELMGRNWHLTKPANGLARNEMIDKSDYGVIRSSIEDRKKF